jgi:phosphatidylserine/phosphatidylglycerophosphate/cardiolipin synthase-like enzyme
VEIAGYCGGKPFYEILQLLEQKLKSNPDFQVRIISNYSLLNSEEKKLYKILIESYPNNFEIIVAKAVWGISPKLLRYENHTKMVIADQKYFVIGGSGIENHMLPPEQAKKVGGKGAFVSDGKADIDLLGEGDLARICKEKFDEVWAKWKNLKGKIPNPKIDTGTDFSSIPLENIMQLEDVRSDTSENTNCEIVLSQPEQGKKNQGEKAYIRMINEAKKTIYISNMVFGRKKIISAVKNAMKRGVTVTVLTNGPLKNSATGGTLIGLRNRLHYEKLIKLNKKLSDAGQGGKIEIYEYAKKDVLLHTKVMVIDAETEQPTVTVGSFNISKESARCDDELLMITKSKQLSDVLLNKLKLFDKIQPNQQVGEGFIPTFEFKWSCFQGRVLKFFLNGVIN